MVTMRGDDPAVVAAVEAIHTGDVDGLRRLLDANPGFAAERIGSAAAENGSGGESRTLLHVATDWPGHFPRVAAIVAALVEAGADVNAAFEGRHAETPLHWAASSDDVGVLDALVDAGADLEAPGGVAGGTPLDDAVAFGQWKAARRLVERGARTALWHAAALGLMDRVDGHFTGTALPGPYPWGAGGGAAPDEVTVAFWCACHGGQLRAAEYLLERGAALNWVSVWDGLTPLDAAERTGADEVVAWLRARGARPANELG